MSPLVCKSNLKKGIALPYIYRLSRPEQSLLVGLALIIYGVLV